MSTNNNKFFFVHTLYIIIIIIVVDITEFTGDFFSIFVHTIQFKYPSVCVCVFHNDQLAKKKDSVCKEEERKQK